VKALTLVGLTLVSLTGCKQDAAPPAGAPAPSAVPGAPPKTPAAAYQRTARSCAEIIAGLEDGMSKESVTPGSWGDVPKELQVVPPGGELCGATARNAPVIRSALFGDDLGAFYQPIATAMGCRWGSVEINGAGDRKTTMVKLTCPAKTGGGASHIHTDSGSEFYYISY
jgi:hypothetical protein